MQFRDYDASYRQEIVKEFYKQNHSGQTVEFVEKMKNQFQNLNKITMSVWEALMKLDEIIDNSDPDLSLKQTVHCFQTAEMIRKKYPENEWLQLVGLIHDCGKPTSGLQPQCGLRPTRGKIMMHPDIYNLPEYYVVGDTFPVGCQWQNVIVYYDFFAHNPDTQNELYQTLLGIYSENIGFDKVLMSWGHDEYMYEVCKQNNCMLPEEALYVIRYHSFYAQHQHKAYDHLANAHDKKMFEYVKLFQQFDLYSKDDTAINFEVTKEMQEYYEGLINKYFPAECKW